MTRKDILKINDKRIHSIKNCYGCSDIYKYLISNGMLDKSIKLSDFSRSINIVNELISYTILRGIKVELPYKMGTLELVKRKAEATFDGNDTKNNFPINWNETIKYWEEDEDARKNKKLIKYISPDIFKIKYSTRNAKFKNKTFYQFRTNRSLKLRMKELVDNDKLDAIYYDN